jgi:hypothetical protein
MMGEWVARATVVAVTHEVVGAGSRIGAEVARFASKRVGAPKLSASFGEPLLQLSSYYLLLNEKKIWQLRGELQLSTTYGHLFDCPYDFVHR